METEATQFMVRQFTVRQRLDDALISNAFHHVHHADSIRILESARTAWLESRHYSLEKLLAEGYLLVLTSLSVEYRREIFGGEIEITVENPRVSGREIILEQRIWRVQHEPLDSLLVEPAAAGSNPAAQEPAVQDKKKEAVRASVHQALVSVDSRRSVAVPEALAKVLGLLSG